MQLLNQHLYNVNSLVDWEKRVGKIRKEEKWRLQLLNENLLRVSLQDLSQDSLKKRPISW